MTSYRDVDVDYLFIRNTSGLSSLANFRALSRIHDRVNSAGYTFNETHANYGIVVLGIVKVIAYIKSSVSHIL
jgi:hypothetical protein